ncbi:MAG TPA: NADH-quinone oxidoreductase subunit J [Bacteroidales bacterium]|nr:NADH-quinone oxidoreductase subunit J [Bacteroidales bacterium]HRZ48720.1 NADH-quinone oxidoreductase subunit J [Bacteroidales bacterium]
MLIAFYIAGVIAVVSTIMAVTRSNAVHALLYLIVSFLAAAVVLFVLGAHFAAALEVIVYAGAIMVLFVFVIMMLNIGGETEKAKERWLVPKRWIGPALMAAILFAILSYAILNQPVATASLSIVEPKTVGISLYTQYLLGVEIAAVMLMAGIIGAFHLGYTKRKSKHRFLKGE